MIFFVKNLKGVLIDPPDKFRASLIVVALILFGSTGFMYYERSVWPDVTIWDSIWWTIVTLATVGYGDIAPKTLEGRFYIGIPLMIFGIGVLAYALTAFASGMLVSHHKFLKGLLMHRLKNHIVIVHCPSVEKIIRIIKELRAEDSNQFSDVVLIDDTLEELPLSLRNLGVRFVHGNPTRDEILSKAGIDDADHFMILAKHEGQSVSDTLSLGIVVAVESRNSKINTVVECVDSLSTTLFKKAGCNNVVCTGKFSAQFLSREVLNPGVQETVDELVSWGGQQIFLTNMDSDMVFNHAVSMVKNHNHIAIGVRRNNDTILNPSGSFQILKTDKIISIGQQHI